MTGIRLTTLFLVGGSFITMTSAQFGCAAKSKLPDDAALAADERRKADSSDPGQEKTTPFSMGAIRMPPLVGRDIETINATAVVPSKYKDVAITSMTEPFIVIHHSCHDPSRWSEITIVFPELRRDWSFRPDFDELGPLSSGWNVIVTKWAPYDRPMLSVGDERIVDKDADGIPESVATKQGRVELKINRE